MARIYDNIDTHFTEGLHAIISNSGVKRVDFCVGYFNLRGWNLVVDHIDRLEGDFVDEGSRGERRERRVCRLLIGMHRPPQDLVRKIYSDEQRLIDSNDVAKAKLEIARDFRNQLLLGLPTKQDELTLRRLSTQLKEKKVCVKLYLREPLHAKLYLAHQPGDYNSAMAIMGSSNLTYSGLTGQGELNAGLGDSDHVAKLANWFDDRWNDKLCLDITDDLIDAIDNSWAADKVIPPYYIYLKTAYHLSAEARAGIKEFTLPHEFRTDLFEFQQTAVKIAARHLNSDKRGGAMIGDVVGLGKTITACAIAKIYENTYGSNTLIICPANLQEMWAKYRRKYDLKADIMSMAKPIDVDNARYYRLIIVDESHNLRNDNGVRYHNIKALIERQSCNVLLLTATPYNKDFSDLSSQLKLFIGDDEDLGIRPEAYIESLGGERKFLQKHSEIHIRSIKAFEKSPFAEDWMELMKLFLVRRTRTFIKENYAKTDQRDGRKYLEFPDGTVSYFPERIPRSLKFDTNPNDQYNRLYSQAMIDSMEKLVLPRYGLSHYVNQEKAASANIIEKKVLENLSRAGVRMKGFCKSTFFKRMDSSGYSFLLTLYHHLLRNMVFIYAIDNNLPLPLRDEQEIPDDFIDDSDINDSLQFGNEEENRLSADMLIMKNKIEEYKKKAQEYYMQLGNRSNVTWINSSFFKRTLKQHLKADCETIIGMIKLCGKWNPDNDPKLNLLEKLLCGKHKGDKVLVFTQYSDTANYICRELQKRGIAHVGAATGGSQNPTAIVDKFSPESNGADVAPQEQTRILVATDVLSEGQNLQDCHVVVNYDLPWAIIRLIQRAGRVDRIGQKEQKIFCYSFFPAEGVENIIRLRSRLNDRINENAEIVGSDEVFFEGNEKNLRDMYNERSGVLDDADDDADVDLASQAYQIWKNATDADPSLKEIIPRLSDVVYSTKKAKNRLEDGVITYVKTHNDYDILSWYDSEGEIVSQSQKRILQALACSADEQAIAPLDNHLEIVGKAVSNTQSDNASVAGILGNRFSTRFRIVELLNNYYEQQQLTLFYDEEKKQMLKYAIDDIYNYQLLDGAKFLLGRMLRNASPDDIVDTVIEMHRNGNLCRIDDDRNSQKDPSIICSMGLRAEQ